MALEKSMIIYEVNEKQYRALVTGLRGQIFHKKVNDKFLIRIGRKKWRTTIEKFAPDAKVIEEFSH